MPKLTEAHIEQIKVMREEGQSYVDIISFFDRTYSITLYDHDIAKVCKGIPLPKKLRHPYKRGRIRKVSCIYTPICMFADTCNLNLCKYKKEA